MANSKGAHRLKNRSDFEKIKKHGRAVSYRSWILGCYIRKQESEGLRVGWTIPGYVGTAVTRNRFKRWIREHIKSLNEQSLKAPYDINLVFKRKKEVNFYRQLERKDLDAAVSELLKKICYRP